MADDEKTLRITAEDDTARGLASASKNVNKLHADIQKTMHTTATGAQVSTRAVEGMAKATGRSYQDVLARVVATTDAFKRGQQAGQQFGKTAGQSADYLAGTVSKLAVNAASGGGAFTRMGAVATGAFRAIAPAINPVAAGLATIAARTFAVGAALEAARRGFLGWAEFDKQLRLVQNQTGMSARQIDALSESMRRLQGATGVAKEELLTAYEELREAGNFTPEETKKMMPDLAIVAEGMGANAGLVGRAMGDVMRNFKIPADQYMAVLEATSHAATEFNLDISKVGPQMSRISEAMAARGYTGADAYQRMVTFMGIAKTATGDAGRAATVTANIFEKLGDESLGKALGFAPGEFSKAIKQVEKDGGDVLGTVVYWMKEATNQREVMEAIGIRDIGVMRQLMAEYDKVGDKIRGTQQATGAVAKGLNITDSPAASVAKLAAAFNELNQALGALMDAVGFSTFFKGLAEEINIMALGATRIAEIFKWLAGGKRPAFLKSGSEERTFDRGVRKDYKGQPLMKWDEFQIVGEEGLRKAYEEYDKKMKAEKDQIDEQQRRSEAEAAAKRREELRQKYPGMVIPEGTLPPSPFQRKGEAEDLEKKAQRLGNAMDDARAKLASFAEEMPDKNKAALLKAGLYSLGAGPSYTPGTIANAAAAAAGGGATYGGSGDARVLPASYSPSGRLWGGPGGGSGGGVSTGGIGIGPGGRGTPYGGGTVLAPPAAGGRRLPAGPAPTPPGGGGGGTGGSFLDALAQIESGNQNIPSRVDPDTAGPGSRSQGFFQIGTPTWRDFAAKAGVDLNQYPNAMSAPRDVQARVASVIPLRRFGPRTQQMLRQRFGDLDRNATIGDLAAKHGTGYVPAAPATDQPTTQPGVPGEGGGLVTEAQGKVAGIRKGALDPQLRTALEYAAEASGVKVRVTSGGQRMHGAPGATGSHRHDKGRAADLDVIDPKTGKVLALDDPRRLKFLEESAAAGAGGTGTRYMDDPAKIHAGITGAGAQVGKGLGAYAGPAHERAAVERGLRRMMTPEQVAAARKAQIEARGGVHPAPTTGSEASTRPPEVAAPPTAPTQLPDQDRQMNVNLKVNDNQVQFARSSMRRQADREVREARWSSYSDIGAA